MHAFVDPDVTGLFQGCRYRGSDLTPIELPNHIPQEFEDWASVEVSQLEQKGCIARWDLVAGIDEPPASQDVPSLEIESKKPRLFWDGRWLNLICSHSPLRMDGVGSRSVCMARCASSSA